ncbi:MAG: CoA pyrophosphatase [Filomicrobium sp.]
MAEQRLHRDPPSVATPGGSDFDLNPGMEEEAGQTAKRPAAVLVPVVAREELSVLLTLRTAHLSSHAGQIAFPGGKLDQGEAVLETALREAQEEIGLAAQFVEPIGYLDWYRTRSGYVVCPILAIVRPGFQISRNPGEVEDVFEVPLAFMLDKANISKHVHRGSGTPRSYYALSYRERFIWGATAGMIKNLADRMGRE